ncbi:GNAT family N-acetyltransferase [Photobacterium phosphoreum]|uniref:GNAT family N-acetyltransferase n=1 Tax=Photobacterium phosphoreum TaxID=659 RepID=UPI0005D426C5|nr:GNAT family N-acetyltransferase [Photobacterium phosphoreum]KJF87292.1 GCN5 family acetyltransferase [Photobacterium phosphoreum]MCD9483226.1 GNAT family N-acetyltransferase [Photobacterium phosphoreum]PQJ90982.1 GNAT family N-acetyltransferase [Photobacterium phosphoreum]PSU35262.1 N-acetyltransferase [Photobacterium phosphoreum]PSV72772.1 N-acetyltransferase [Photobacterium phosphoreum]
MKLISETQRLIIRQLTLDDAEFIIQLLNEESFIRYIADKNVRTHADAVNYLMNGPLASYRDYGFGLNVVLLKETTTPIGICGLLKRAELDYPDLGYAFLTEFCQKGYATEAAFSVLNAGMKAHSLDTVLAVTLLDNESSNRLLQKIGFELKGTMALYGSQNNVYEYMSA